MIANLLIQKKKKKKKKKKKSKIPSESQEIIKFC